MSMGNQCSLNELKAGRGRKNPTKQQQQRFYSAGKASYETEQQACVVQGQPSLLAEYHLALSYCPYCATSCHYSKHTLEGDLSTNHTTSNKGCVPRERQYRSEAVFLYEVTCKGQLTSINSYHFLDKLDKLLSYVDIQ